MIFRMALGTSNGCNFFAMSGSLVSQYFMNSIDILTIKANARYKSRAMVAIFTRISALTLLYTITRGQKLGFSRMCSVSLTVLLDRSEADLQRLMVLYRLVPRGIFHSTAGDALQ
jgi:hypothetical protein